MIVDSKIFELATRRVERSKVVNSKNTRKIFFNEANSESLTHQKFAELMLSAFIMQPRKFRFARHDSEDDLKDDFLIYVFFDIEPIVQEEDIITIDTFKLFYPIKFSDRFRDITGVKIDLFEIRFGCIEICYASKLLNDDVLDLFKSQPGFLELCESYFVNLIKYNGNTIHRKK